MNFTAIFWVMADYSFTLSESPLPHYQYLGLLELKMLLMSLGVQQRPCTKPFLTCKLSLAVADSVSLPLGEEALLGYWKTCFNWKIMWINRNHLKWPEFSSSESMHPYGVQIVHWLPLCSEGEKTKPALSSCLGEKLLQEELASSNSMVTLLNLGFTARWPSPLLYPANLKTMGNEMLTFFKSTFTWRHSMTQNSSIWKGLT